MRKFIVLNKGEMMTLCLNKPVDICIDNSFNENNNFHYLLCTEEYYLENVLYQPDEVVTKKGVMTKSEAQRYYEGVFDGFRESEKCFREENQGSEQKSNTSYYEDIKFKLKQYLMESYDIRPSLAEKTVEEMFKRGVDVISFDEQKESEEN